MERSPRRSPTRLEKFNRLRIDQDRYQKWSDDIFKASGGKSKGNLRAMHGKVAAGRFDDIVFDDANKADRGCAKVV